MPIINLDTIEEFQNEPKMRLGAKGFISIPSVGMRLSPEVLVLELFRDTFFTDSAPGQLKTRELQPNLRNDDNMLVFTDAERAAILALRGRRKQTKNSRDEQYYAPAYPSLARDSWLRKKGEHVISRLLFEGAFSQHLWSNGETECGQQKQRAAIDEIVSALIGTKQPGHCDIIAAAIGDNTYTVNRQKACKTLLELTNSSPTVFQTDHDELADRVVEDFLAICRLEQKVPRLLWIRILMTYLRFSLPIWLLAQMRITCLVHQWLVDAVDGKDFPDENGILHALASRNHNLISPTLTPTREVFSRIKEYIRCRVELNVLLACLEQLQPHKFNGKTITTQKIGAKFIILSDVLTLARSSAPTLKADPAYGISPSARVFLSRTAERYRAWNDPLNKGQGKNIDEFLRVLYRSERGDEAGGYLLVREGRGESTGFRVFPGQFLLQTIAFLAGKAKQADHRKAAGGGKLVLQDIEEQFTQYGIDFSIAADARPFLINELQQLGLLAGSPDAGSSVAVSCPF